jgi:nicotinamide mononucleotide adenylyltransferase
MDSPVILVCCGSFNPPTLGHLRMMEMAKEHIELFGFKVLKGFYSPTNDCYDKKKLVKGEHRIAMLGASIQGSSWLNVHEWEVKQPKWSTTASVLKQIQSEYPDNRIMLVAGSDIIKSFNVPGLWDEADVALIISQDYGLIIIERVTVKASEMMELMLSRPIIYKSQRYIWLVGQPIINEISSSKVRQLLNMGCNVRYLISDSSYEYIMENKLYQ